MAQSQYNPLQEQQIRLFQLTLNDWDEPLSGRLITFRHPRHFALSWKNAAGWVRNWHDLRFTEKEGENFGYDALSYAWGEYNPNDSHLLDLSITGKVYVTGLLKSDGKALHHGIITIRKNLYDLLKQLRTIYYDRFIWIDSICINQLDDDEKSGQIALMGEIYKEAKQVLVWLGQASPDEEAAITMMPAITKILAVNAPKGALSPSIPTTFEAIGLPPYSHSVWTALGSIMSRSWFSRVWTLQEAVLPPKARVLCGSREIAWETLVEFASIVNQNCGSHFINWTMTGDPDIAAPHHNGYDAVYLVDHCRDGLKKDVYGVPLKLLLNASRRREAQNPVDMIFGMLGMAARGLVRDFAINMLLPPVALYVEFARYYLRNEVYECIVNHTETLERLPGLPSWCPNLASPAATHSIGSRWILGRDASPFAGSQGFCAGYATDGEWAMPHISPRELLQGIPSKIIHQHDFSGGLNNTGNPRQISPTSDRDRIRATGLLLDVVLQVVPARAANEGLSSQARMSELVEWESRCLALAKVTLPDTEDVPAVYWRTLIANQVLTQDGGNLIVWDKHGEVDHLPMYLQWKSDLDHGPSDDINQTWDLTHMGRETRRYAAAVQRMTTGRCMFATESGRIGLGPADTRIGDRVCVFFYCPTPYILSKSGDIEHFVGETYVHDLMLDRGEVQEQRFLIG